MKATIISVTSLLALASSVAAHASLKYPCPRYSPFGENCPAVPAGQSLDSGINAPISSMTLGQKNPFCKYTTPFATPSATWTAGESVTVKFHDNIAAHSGGHGQFSISYDNGKTFAVVHEVLRYMFVGSKPASVTNTASVMSYTFKLPEDLPSSDKAVFAWTWANASGNREFYMNCADIAIKGGKSKSYTGKKMTVVNYPGYPAMAEFNGNYDTGIELYNNAPKVTISPSGSSSAPSNSGNDKPPKGDSKPPKNEPVPHAPKSSVPAAPAPTGSSGSGSCTHGAMACDSGNSGYKVCVYGNWNPPIPCPAGTKCKSSGGSAVCDWA